ncbi:hypothetical protein Tco_0413199 [Tanacetum coccineum]
MIEVGLIKRHLNNAQTKTNQFRPFRSILENQLTGPNFNEWLRALKLVVRTEKLQDVFETPFPPAPAASADNQALADWNALFDRSSNELALFDAWNNVSKTPNQQFENKSPKRLITELQMMYGKPPGVETLRVSEHVSIPSLRGTCSQLFGNFPSPTTWCAIQSGRVQKNKPQGKAKGKEKGRDLEEQRKLKSGSPLLERANGSSARKLEK